MPSTLQDPTHVQRISPDDGGQYMHGFYNIQPWDPSGLRMLIHRLPFIDRMPTGAEPAQLGLLHMDSREFTPFAETRAWNYQLGCLPHWVDTPPDHARVLYNDKRNGRFVSVLRDPDQDAERIFDCPVFTVSHNGRYALGYDFARLQPVRPGYAYAGVPYLLDDRPKPEDDGVVRIDLQTGETRLILSYARLAQAFPHADMEKTPVFVSRLLFNADDRRIVLSFRFRSVRDNTWHTCLVTADPDGRDLYELAAFADRPAHFDWREPDRLVAWLHPPDASAAGFHEIEDRTGLRVPLAQGILEHDGHCCFGVDTRRMLLDSFPDADQKQSLLLFDCSTRNVTTLGRFTMPPVYGWSNHGGDLRCDLHPCWSRDGRQVCFDSMHENRRAVYGLPIRGV